MKFSKVMVQSIISELIHQSTHEDERVRKLLE
jgi:hypothetical protein